LKFARILVLNLTVCTEVDVLPDSGNSRECANEKIGRISTFNLRGWIREGEAVWELPFLAFSPDFAEIFF